MADHQNKDQVKGNLSNEDFFNVSFDRPIKESKQESQPESTSKRTRSSKWNDFYQRFKEEELRKYGMDYDDDSVSDPNLNHQKVKETIVSKTLRLDKTDLLKAEKNQDSIFSKSFNRVQNLLKDLGENEYQEAQPLKNRSPQDMKMREKPSFIQSNRTKQSHKPIAIEEIDDNKKAKTKSPSQSFIHSQSIDKANKNDSNNITSDNHKPDLIFTPTHNNFERKAQNSANISNENSVKFNEYQEDNHADAILPKRSEIHNRKKRKQVQPNEPINSDKNEIEFIPVESLSRTNRDQKVSKNRRTKNNHDDMNQLSFPGTDAINKETQQEDIVDEKKDKNKRTSKKAAYSISEYSAPKKATFTFSVILNVIKKLVLIFIILGILGAALAGGMGVGYFANLVADTDPPTKEEMASKIYQLDQQSTLYYASGQPIANVRTDVVRSVTNLDNVSQYIIDGFIATEDEYFAEHPGIVPKAILRAVLETFITGSGSGGSTLTQQLVKQQLLTNEVTFFRKANEILLALRLEKYFSKEEILTAYLNVSPFGRNNSGDNVAGIGKASEGIFGVKPDKVNLNQAAFLAGLPQDPYRYTPYDQFGQLRENLEPGIQRMKDVLFRMYRDQRITKEEFDQAMTYDITKDFLKPQPRVKERQSYLYQAIMYGAIQELMLLNIKDDGYTWQEVFQDVDWYNEYYFAAEDQLRTGGYKVYSTIDKEIYDQLQESAKAYEDEIGVVYDGVYTDPQTGHETYYIEKVQTGLVAIDNPTGKVLGFVSGTDFENNQIDHAFTMRRSPGSTIKPMAVYAPAIEHNLINPATVIPDTAFVEEYDDGTTWEPTNYGNAVSGDFMTARRALLRSDNLPAVRIYNELLNRGIPIIDYLAKMGFNTVDSYTEADTHNLAFSLGGVTTGPTVFEETRGFTTFANNGYYIDGYYIERIEDAYGNVVFQHNEAPVKVFSEDTNYLMVDMLRDTMTEGTGRTAASNMVVPGDWIAKTGISENSKDIWVIASTPKITIGSWIGYDSKYYDYTIDVNDGFGLESVRSQIYWARIINDLYAIRPEIFGSELTFSQPSSVVEQQILQETGTLPGTTTFNGQTYTVSQPLTTDLFKVSNPAPPLTGNFLFGATPEEQGRFWQQRLSREQEYIIQQQRLQQQQQQQQTTTEGSESSEEASVAPPAEVPVETPETALPQDQE